MTAYLTGERNRWLAALLVTALLLAATYLVSDVVFQTNDDNAIVAAAAGGVTGAPYAGNGFTSYLYGALLAGLYGAFPGVPWHALLLTAAQAVSLAALCRSALYLCVRKRISPLWGLMGFAALYAGVGAKFMVYLQFTATPGYCAGALAALLWTLPEGKRARVFTGALGFGVMAFGLLLRLKGGLLALPVPIIVCVCKAFKRDGGRRTALLCAAALIAFTAGAWALDGALYQAKEPGWREQAAFDQSSAVLLDYHNDDETYALALQVTDWSPELIRGLRSWNLFIDPRFNTDNLTRLAEAMEEYESAPTAFEVLKKTASVVKRYQEFRWNALAFGLAGAWALYAFLHARRWQEALLLAGLAASLLAVIALFYGWLNRLPDRVAFAYAWPVYGTALLLFLDAPRDEGVDGEGARGNGLRFAFGQARQLPAVGAALLALAAIITLSFHWSDTLVLPAHSAGRQSRAVLTARANFYAAEHPDILYATDVTQGFYAFSPERPPVNLLEWGSAMIRSPMYRRKMEALGYPDGFTSQNLADENVRVLLSGPDALELLTNYMKADIGDWNAVLEDDQGLFQVYRLE